jgi:hypothetical protein
MFIFLDTETTGSGSEDRLCQIAFKTEGGKAIDELFNPGMPISIEAMVIHHITNEMVADKPKFKGSDTHKKLQLMFADPDSVAEVPLDYLEWLSGTKLDEDLAYTVRHYLIKTGEGEWIETESFAYSVVAGQISKNTII